MTRRVRSNAPCVRRVIAAGRLPRSIVKLPQRTACVDFAVVVERKPNDLKHERDPRVGLVDVCGTPPPLREFDKAREARRLL